MRTGCRVEVDDCGQLLNEVAVARQACRSLPGRGQRWDLPCGLVYRPDELRRDHRLQLTEDRPLPARANGASPRGLAPLTSGSGSSGPQAFDPPSATGAHVSEPIVQPVRAALPELDRFGRHPVPTPEVWKWRAFWIEFLQPGYFSFERSPAGQQTALRRRGGCDPVAVRPQRPVFL